MCGINGFYDLKNKYSIDETYSLVHAMNERIIHRGPDHEGMYQHQNITMGMRRLSIIDLGTGNQPIYSNSKRYVIVFNGEVYNFQEIRNKLEAENYTFYTTSDTEVVVNAYEAYGEKSFDMLDGMYAFSIYDIITGELIIVRDRMGEKPLYYSTTDKGAFIYGSELKSLISSGVINKKIDKHALNIYLQLTYIPAPYCIFEGVCKLMPGHMLKINATGDIEDKIYWDIRNISKNTHIDYETAKTKLYELAEKSVKERMVADVPLGAFLSGGIDSSTIVGLMTRASDRPVETYTIGFHEAEYDERARARLVAELNNTNHHEYVVDYKDALAVIDSIMENMDEPFADSSVIPTYYVSRFASGDVKVVLTGDAGDELFLGYDKYLIGYYDKLLHKLPEPIVKICKKIAFSMPDKSTLSRKLRKVLGNYGKDILEQRIDLMSLGFKENDRQQLLKESYFDNQTTAFIKDRYYSVKSDSTELTHTQYTDISTVLEGDMLTKVDRMSMLNSLETRTPLLSRDIVEFAWSIPDEYKLNGKNKKCIMKDTFSSILPENFDKLPKSGFGVPLDDWFRNDLKSLMQRYLNREKIEKEGIFNWDFVEYVIRNHQSEKINYKFQIWTLLVFEKWIEEIL